MSDNNFNQLMSAPASTLCRSGTKPIIIEKEEDPATAFAKLVNAGVLSAPVSEKGQFIGNLDMRDLVSLVCHVAERKEADSVFAMEARKVAGGGGGKGEAKQRDNHRLATMTVLLSHQEKKAMEGGEMTCEYLARRHPFVRGVTPSTPLSVVAKHLQIHKSVPVVAENDTLVDIISQAMFVAYLRDHLKDLPSSLTSQQVKGLGTAPVKTVTNSDKALAVFQFMDKHNLRGLAVVDKDGKISGNTSASDLKLCLSNFSLLALQTPIWEYLKIIRQMDVRDVRPPVVTVKESDTLALVIGKLAATKLHRLFVVDQLQFPKRVMSLTDVMCALPLE